MGNSEIRAAFVLKDRRRLRETYLAPALRDHLIEYTLPDQPNRRLKKYRPTAKGHVLLAQLTSSARPPSSSSHHRALRTPKVFTRFSIRLDTAPPGL